jgi:hypothetical protein
LERFDRVQLTVIGEVFGARADEATRVAAQQHFAVFGFYKE